MSIISSSEYFLDYLYMVKLLRCVANITQSDTEIKARFDEPLIIEANSKIALLNLRARFPTSESEGSFTIVEDVNDTLSVDNQATTIPKGTYSPSSFDDVLETFIAKDCGNGAGSGILTTLGIDLRVSFATGKFQLTKRATNKTTADWDNDWTVEGGNPDLTTDGTFISDAGASTSNQDAVFNLFHTVPNATFNCTATVTAVSTAINKPWELGAYEQGSVFAIGMDSFGNYGFKHFSNTFQPFTGGTLAPTTAPQANDRVSILRTGNQVVYQVRRGSTLILSTSAEVTEANQRRLNAYLNRTPVAHVISANDGLTLTSCQFTTLSPDPINPLLRNIPSQVSLNFTNPPNLDLAKYLGFATLGPFTEFGEPAVLLSPNLISPDEKTIGIIVTIDPLVLESYDGDTRPVTKKGRDSILAVLNQVGSLGKTFVLDVNFPVALGIRNVSGYTVNQLNLRFKNQSNGQVLEFDKDTFLTLLIYGPNENP